MPTTIYALCEPDLQVPVIRYIGKTGKKAPSRFKEHLNQSVKSRSHLGHWLNSLRSRGEMPVLMTLTQVPDEIGSAAEILYIRLAREGGMNLVNATDGGEGTRGFIPSLETRKKNGDANRGKKRTQETCELISRQKLGPKNPHFGVPFTAAQQAAASVANSLRVWTPEAREIAREAKIGARNPNFGKTRSEATRAKQSETCRAVFALRRMPYFSDGGGI